MPTALGASLVRRPRPKILIATTCRWFSAARVAMSFADVGCQVEAVCPSGHPMLLTRRVQRCYSYLGFAPSGSLRSAIEQANADLIIPCDELAVQLLHSLYRPSLERSSSRLLLTSIERSLGDPDSYSLIESRTRFLAIASEEGIPIPQTTALDSVEDVTRWLAQHSLPAVVKADGTSGGEGVKIVDTPEQALRAFQRLKAPLSTAVVAKRTLIDRDPNLIVPWFRQRQRSVSIQPLVRGRDANIAVACWRGQVLASVGIEVLQTGISKGPAAVVRILPDGEMLRAAEKIVRRLKISGLCGLDFMIDEETGIPHLIEINARATQTGHLPLGPGHDLSAALTAALTGEPIREREPVIRDDVVALFPLAWQTDPASAVFKTGYHDVPWEEPRLVRAGLARPSPINYPNLVRVLARMRHSFVSPASRTRSGSSKRDMKYHVLHLIGSNLVGGPEKQILHHAEDMQGSEYEIEIGSFHDLSDRPEILAAAEQRNVPTMCLKGGVHWGMVSELAQQLRGRKGYLLCTHGFKANVVGYLASRRTNTLHIPTLRGWTAETWRVRIYEVLERQVLRRAPIVMCVSAKQAEQIAQMRGSRTKPFVIPNAMLPPYARTTNEEAVSRRQLGIPEDAFVYGSVGRLSAEKGHRYMISAFQEACGAADVQQPLRLIVVGDGREQESLEEQATELGIRDKVHFAGYQGNCDEWMRLFDCMVQPSLTEGTPNSVLEALCLQVPVVATAVGGVPDLIVDGHNGLLVPSGDAHALAEGMLQLVRSPELKSRLIAGTSTLKEEYAPETQRQRLIAVYQMAFGSQPTRELPLSATLKA